ncbi:LysR family transcriptional regulator [Donghicola tyrosinivorans]|uniref:DNA-binding transcriptional LysR family regulator n=1 Tax=Donghicola tyrosinivorans TaxID=1652492 RepID=A0A2T0WTS8_9RHOB|nr:LysR family transcriptional regulator [Donghicola tyrosinivorans]PRY90112.1 DNA-binding transcriptional LysR family regulator [Donghicola tyrosinivorans]
MPKFQNWDDLRYLIALHRTGNMAAAAARLNSNPATVSRRMTRLAEALGYPPFEKRPDGWELNPRLETIVEHAIQFDGELASAISQESQESEGELTGNVTVCCPPILATHMLYPKLNEFLQQHPRIHLNFKMEALQESLNENDVIITYVQPTQGRLISSAVGEMSFALYENKAARGTNQWAGLTSEFDKQGPMRTALDYWATEPIVRVDSFQSLVQVAAVSGLSAPLPCLVGDPDPNFDRIKDGPEIATYKMYQCYHETRRSDPVLKVVREWLRDTILTFTRKV